MHHATGTYTVSTDNVLQTSTLVACHTPPAACLSARSSLQLARTFLWAFAASSSWSNALAADAALSCRHHTNSDTAQEDARRSAIVGTARGRECIFNHLVQTSEGSRRLFRQGLPCAGLQEMDAAAVSTGVKKKHNDRRSTGPAAKPGEHETGAGNEHLSELPALGLEVVQLGVESIELVRHLLHLPRTSQV